MGSRMIWSDGLGLGSSWSRDCREAEKTPLSEGCLRKSGHAKLSWLP